MIALPLAGYLGSVFSGYPVKFFGLALPSWGAKDVALKELMSTAHLALGWMLAATVALHVAAAARHAWIQRDDVVRRMLWSRTG